MQRIHKNQACLLTIAAAGLLCTLTSVDAVAQVSKQSRECTIEDVAIYENRVVIQCDVKGGKTSPAKYYAIGVASPIAPMVLQLGLSSLKRKVKVFFVDDASLNPDGCEASNCRQLEGIVAIDR
jgi:hypothetical protein